MAISFGPKLGLLYNSLIGESYFDSLRLFLQSIDQLVNGSIINATQVSPPTSPNPGDSYLLIGGTPGGSWTGQAGNIAVWDAQLTSSGTNNVVPGWIFLTPKAGWIVWNVALASLSVFSGSAWNSLSGGANFPANTNITSMSGIPNTSINSSGYAFNDGTNPSTTVGLVTSGGAGPNGLQYGAGTFASPNATGTVIIGEGPWTGLSASGVGIGIASTAGSLAITSSGLQTSGTVQANFVNALTQLTSFGLLEVASAGIRSNSPNVTIPIGMQGTTTNPVSVLISSGLGTPTTGVGLIGFDSNYFTQTTVGAAGAASALPVTPRGYLQFVAPDGHVCVWPFYSAA